MDAGIDENFVCGRKGCGGILKPFDLSEDGMMIFKCSECGCGLQYECPRCGKPRTIFFDGLCMFCQDDEKKTIIETPKPEIVIIKSYHGNRRENGKKRIFNYFN